MALKDKLRNRFVGRYKKNSGWIKRGRSGCMGRNRSGSTGTVRPLADRYVLNRSMSAVMIRRVVQVAERRSQDQQEIKSADRG